MAERDVQDLNRESDALGLPGHRRQERGGVPGCEAGRSGADEIEARDDCEAGFLGRAPGGDQLLVTPASLARFDTDPHLSHEGTEGRSKVAEGRATPTVREQ
jgi:hypothetical protein